MWEITTLVTVPRIYADHTELTSFPAVWRVPGGRIPSRSTIEAEARRRVADQIGFLSTTMSNRPYDYGDPGGVTIVSITFIR